MDCKSGNIASSTNDGAASPIEGSILGCFVSSVEIELNSCGLLSILLVGEERAKFALECCPFRRQHY